MLTPLTTHHLYPGTDEHIRQVYRNYIVFKTPMGYMGILKEIIRQVK